MVIWGRVALVDTSKNDYWCCLLPETAANLVGVHRNTAAYYFHRLRLVIMEAVNQGSLFDGEVELD